MTHSETSEVATPAPKPYRVLSLDGGGVRGLYTAVLLEGIAKRVARQNGQPDDRMDLGKHYDLIVGTSTGALLAGALAVGVPMDRVIDLYRKDAKKIFDNPVPTGRWKLLPWIFRQLGQPAHGSNPLRAALFGILGDVTLGQVYAERGIALCIPAVNASTRKSWIFKTPHDRAESRLQRDNDVTLVDACLASAAAPIEFPLASVRYRNEPGSPVRWFVDGGLYANNPVIVAIVEALAFASLDAPIEVLSVGTCPPSGSEPVDANRTSPGIAAWLRDLRILETALDAQAFAYHNIARFLAAALGRVTYIRLEDPTLSAADARLLRLDNASTACLDRLVELAHDAVDRNMSLATVGTPPMHPLLKMLTDVPMKTPIPGRSVPETAPTHK